MLRKSFLVLLIGCLTAFTQDNLPHVSLSGTVKDDNGSAIEGAEVSLANLPSLSATTNQDGIFIIEHDVGVIKPYGLSIQNSQRAGIKGNLLQFTVTSETKNGFIEIFTANGRRSAMISLGKLQAGTHTQEIPSLTAGFYVMNITLDQSVTTLRLVNSGSKMHVNKMTKSTGQNNVLRKTAQTVDDTLVVSKEDYITAKVALDTYIKEDIEIVLEKESGPIECVLPDLPSPSSLNYENEKLPSPFVFFDGTEMTRKDQWPCRRQEILAMAQKYIYGWLPPTTGDDVEISGSVTGSGITANITYNGSSKSVTFETSGSGDILGISYGSSFAPTSGILPKNCRIWSILNGDMDSWNNTIQSIYGQKAGCRVMAAAWAVNVACAVIDQNPDGGINPNKIMVTGCSASGKSAFVTGAFCEGVDLTVIVESGGIGAASYRMAEWFRHGGGSSKWQCNDAKPQSLDNTDHGDFSGAPYFNEQTASWVTSSPSKVKNLPYDQHCLLACIAPRALCHLTNANGPNAWCHLGGTCEALSGWAAEPVWNALGVPENMGFRVPNNSYSHCSAPKEHTDLADEFFDRVFNGNENADTDVMNLPKDNLQQDPAEWKSMWVDWDMNKTLD